MEEQQVSTDGESYPLKAPFFVIATQNPREQLGTFDLPESQLDRFAMRLSIGFPDLDSEMAMLKRGKQTSQSLAALSVEQLLDLQQQVSELHCSDALLDYLLRLVHCSRVLEGASPLSPRCSLTLLACAKAWAFVQHKQHVSPEDVQAVFSAVSAHRLGRGDSGEAYAKQILAEVDPYSDLT
jgi:MoxR-like ATPase